MHPSEVIQSVSFESATARLLRSGSKSGDKAWDERANRWILRAVSMLLVAGLTPCMVRAQSVDRSAAPPRLEEQQAVDRTGAPLHLEEQLAADRLAASPPAEEKRIRRTMPWRIVPGIALWETYTDNVTRAPSASAQSGWIRELVPSLRIEGIGPRVSGLFDYRLRDLSYANMSQLNSRQNLLNSNVTIEAAENWFFVDARASITQQNTSAFAATTPNFASASSNQTETTVFQLSPYLRGKVSDIAAYQIRFNQTNSRTSNNTLPATETAEWVARIKNTPSSSKLGWSLDSDALAIRNDAAGKRQDGRIRGTLIYDIYPELHASVMYGRENTDYASSTMQSSNTPGIGVEWSPGARTQFAAVKERRFFGDGRSLVLSHRTPLVALKYTDDKDATVMPNQIAAGGQGSVYALMSDLLTSSIPDPVARGQAVKSRLEQTGVSAISGTIGGFVTSRIFVSHNRDASAVLIGRTNTITLTLSQRDRQSIGLGATSVTDSFSSSADIRQQIESGAWVHRLSPLSTMTLTASRLHTIGLSTTSSDSRQDAQSLFYTKQIGAKTSASAGVRRAQFSSTISPGYRESALVGSLSASF